MDQQQQQQSPMVKLTSKNHRTLPILDYYLTFIHYFGFGINPDDDHRSRYLSIRVKRAQQHDALRKPTISGRPEMVEAQVAGGLDRQWFASYTRRAQRRIHSLPFPLSTAYLRTGMKYVAITFNIFITANHCIVLVDYVCSGSRRFEDIILDIRLVITKLSALIFVLSWHYKRHEVRQLIKLVKSTSLYILATHGQQLQRSHRSAAASSLIADKQSLLAPDSPIPSPTVIAGTAAATSTGDLARVTTAAARLTSNEIGSGFGPSPTKQPPQQQQQQQQHRQQQQQQQRTDTNEIVSDEIGSSLKLDTSAFDRRILKGWFGCLLIIIVHFSLSQAEISKSYHLWQWLDDYSLHQLGNQSVSYDTLMFLATFDNYIYTVHVYGTRLIGASIICIVCSLQHEVIKSLNLYTLRLIQCSHQSLLKGRAAPSDSHTWQVREGTSQGRSPTARSPAPSSAGSQVSLIGGARSVGPDMGPARAANGHLDPSVFFVLGESDWFRVRDLRHLTEPSGYLTGFLWQLFRRHLYRPLESCVGSAKQAWRRIWSCARRRGEGQTSDSPDQEANRRPDMRRVTPRGRPTEGADESTLGQIASSLIISFNGCAAHEQATWPNQRRAYARPTPLTLTASAMGGCADDGPHLTRFVHATGGAASRFQFFASPLPTFDREQRRPAPSQQQWAAANGRCATTGLTSAQTALCWTNPLRSSDEYQARLMAMIGGAAGRGRQGLPPPLALAPLSPGPLSPPAGGRQRPMNQLGARKIELQLERLSTKYELVRTVNSRIDACFGPMLLIQFFFLFLMSCIDLVFFSLCFSPNTKTKYIIISGMILLWCPYLLIYKFASDMGSSSRELLVSIRRLARLYLLEDQASLASAGSANANGQPLEAAHTDQHLWSAFRLESTNRILYNNHLLASSSGRLRKRPLPVGAAPLANCGAGTKIGAGIIDKLDHIFKPTHLSIMGVMTVDKFFLLNFAKIVITSSVMMIQFISS